MFKGMDHLGEKTQDSFESPDGSCVTLYCHLCADTTQHLSLKDTALFVAVDRWTVHRWMKQGIVHGATLPCGVRVICESSLADTEIHLPRWSGLSLPEIEARTERMNLWASLSTSTLTQVTF